MGAEVVYKVSYAVDNFGKTPCHEVRVLEYTCKETDKCIIVKSEARRISKDKLDVVSDNEWNNIKGIKVFIWTLEKDKIPQYQEKLKGYIINKINSYKQDIANLEKALKIEVDIIVRDYKD